MEEVLTDVAAASAQLARVLGERGGGVDPNRIFCRMEALLEEPRDERVARVVQELAREEQESLRTTPSDSVISINDDDSKDDMIDLTSYEEVVGKQEVLEDLAELEEQGQEEVEVEDEEDSTESRLRADTARVLRILADESGPPQEWEEVYAYLEAHLLKVNRVQIVVEEFLGMAESRREETPSPHIELRQPSPDPLAFLGKGKGKGKGKRVGARAISPEQEKEQEHEQGEEQEHETKQEQKQELGEGEKQDHGREKREHSPEEEPVKKQKVESPVSSPILTKKRRPRKTVRQEPLTDEMLYGPFDFSSHRNGAARQAGHRTQNLPADLQVLVEGAARNQVRKTGFSLTPSRLGGSAEVSVLPTTPTRNYIQAGRLAGGGGGAAMATPPRTAKLGGGALVTPPRSSLGKLGVSPGVEVTPPRTPLTLRPLKLLLPQDREAARRERAPSVEVVGEEVRAGPVVVELEEEPPQAEVAELAGNLGAMFPHTPHDYILSRCGDLVGRPAAIERFTEELLARSSPPPDWRRIYARPWSLPQEQVLEEPLVLQDEVEEQEHPPPVPAPDLLHLAHEEALELPLALAEPPPAAADLEEVQQDSAPPAQQPALPDPAAGRVAGTSGGRGAEVEVDTVAAWQEEKQDFMVSMFPALCPDWLLCQVQACSCLPQPATEPGPDLGGEGGVEEKRPVSVATMDLVFQTKVEEIFLLGLEDRNALPSRSQWEARQKQRAELEKWSGAMSVSDMLELYEDDPDGYFSAPERKPESEAYTQHALAGLKDQFRFHSIAEIEKSFKKARCLFTPAFRHLKQMMATGKKTRRTQRPDFEIKYPIDPCIEILKEKKFCELEGAIKEEKERRAGDREAAVSAARAAGSLEECGCCYSPDCLREDMIQCKGGHCYCRECVARGASVAIGDGKTIIECLGHCREEIGWQELQKALAPNILSKLLQRRQAEEVGAAGMEDLVTCPFCPYQTIMENPDDRVLACRNPECGRESCRLCKEPNHVPLRCDEVEKKDEEEARKRIEEQLSEAMIRECWKCRAKYFKEEGCNKMTCPKPGCGAKMCYLCKQPVKDYTHFYGQGGAPTATKTCPLWTDNKRLHEQEVAQAAAKAREELAAQNPDLKLKHDPTKGIQAPEGPVNNQGQVPDIGEVIAPGVPREEIVRQQRYIEQMILGRGGAHGHPLRFHPHPHLHGGPPRYHPGVPAAHQHLVQGVPVPHPAQHLPAPGNPWQDGFIARMGEILRLREQNRANLRVVRQREQQAMRELQRANNLLPAPAFGLPQAVPEPAPFLELVEAQGRNIQVVQQQRVAHYFPGPQHQHLAPYRHLVLPQEDLRRQERRAALQEEDRQRGERAALQEQRRRQERRERHEVVRDQLEQNRQRRKRMEEEERARDREQAVSQEQRERAARSREEALQRLRRNREEVLRRQRRHREEGRGQEGRQGAEPRARGEGQAERQFNFQEILDLDALNPDYLAPI